MVTAEDVRCGLESLDLTEARLEELGLKGFMPPLKVTCEDHSGAHAVYVQQWDGSSWQKATDWFAPMTDVVRPMLEQAAVEYVKANPGWPQRAERLRLRPRSEAGTVGDALAARGQQHRGRLRPCRSWS